MLYITRKDNKTPSVKKTTSSEQQVNTIDTTATGNSGDPGSSPKKGDWEPNGNPVAILVSIGIAGFLFGLWLFDALEKNNDRGFQELVLANKHALIKEIHTERITQLNHILDSIQKRKIKIPADTANRSIVIASLRAAKRDAMLFASGNVDTLDYFSRIMILNRDVLSKAIRDTGWGENGRTSLMVKFKYIDSSIPFADAPFFGEKSLELRVVKNERLMDFISSNPLFGLWIVFSIAQLTLWFLVIPILYSMLNGLKEKVKEIPPELFNVLNWLLSSIIPFIFLGIFSYIFYWLMIDDIVIKDRYFLKGFNQKMILYSVIGYLAAISCFGIYLLMSLCLDKLNKYARDNNKSMANDASLKQSFLALKKTFDRSFMASAVILSIFVLWIGITFNATNQTEALRFFSLYSRKPLLSYDFVYLVGAMHTVILLIFYIPVKLKFNSMEIAEEARSGSDASGNKLLKGLYENIAAILLTASPLITSIIQKLFETAVN